MIETFSLNSLIPSFTLRNTKNKHSQTQFFEMCVNVTDKLREKFQHYAVQGKNGRETRIILSDDDSTID